LQAGTALAIDHLRPELAVDLVRRQFVAILGELFVFAHDVNAMTWKIWAE
jgi:hypothetical protein